MADLVCPLLVNWQPELDLSYRGLTFSYCLSFSKRRKKNAQPKPGATIAIANENHQHLEDTVTRVSILPDPL